MLYRRTLRHEPLEDRRLLALVTVDTLSDTVDLGDGFTSLREAIFATNLVGGHDTIQFHSSLTARGPTLIALTQGELRISDNLTIDGPGANLITIDASASDPTPDENNSDGSRIFNIDDASLGTLIDVTIAGLILSGGDVRGHGGAILSHENLIVQQTLLSQNAAIADETTSVSYGGAIAQLAGNLTITGSVIANNSSGFGGGIYFNGNALRINGSVVAENSGLSGAGIYHVRGDGEILSSSIRNNSAGAFSLGGGIYNSGNLRIDSTTISGNSADYGGGVFSRTETTGDNETLIVNSTISGNTAFSRGGGVRNALGRTKIEFSTITANTAPPGQGSGLASRGYSTARTDVQHSIIAGNTNSDVDFGTGTSNTFDSRGYNLIGSGNAVGVFTQAGDRVGIDDPLLGPLADNGGATLPDGSKLRTHALLPGSPAINAGDLNARAGTNGVPLYDQRGEPFARIVNGRIDIGAFEYQQPSDLNLLVDTLTDESDNNHGRGDLSLREAIELANLYPSTDTIRFDPALTAAGPATILLARGGLQITGDLSINGPGAEMLTVDASGNDPTPTIDDGMGITIFRIGGGSAAIRGLTLTGGDSRFAGGAIFSFGNLTVVDCIIVDNAARGISYDGGGGIYSPRNSLTVVRSIISGNSAWQAEGGGIRKTNGVLILEDSTISDNSAGGKGGGISAADSIQVHIRNSTIRNNSAGSDYWGGGLYLVHGVGESTIEGTIITGNSAVDGGGMMVADARLTVTGSTVSDNSTSSSFGGIGGGIWSSYSHLTLVRSVITGNSAGYGGGIFSSTELPTPITLIETTISNNAACFNGGGIISSGMNITAIGCTISGNTADGNGGGIAHVRDYIGRAGVISLVNSTVSGNRSKQHGGGIYVDGHESATHSITHSTIAFNVSDSDDSGSGSGGGLFVKSGNVLLDHTIAAGNHDNTGMALDVAGVIHAGFSLIGFGSAFLGPLANNGGPTMTHALRSGSPAVNAGDPAAMAGVGGVPQHDQRGAPFARVYGGRIDIGAFELQPNPLPGDYNFNGVVDTADAVVWRKSLNSTTDLRADGNGDGIVNQDDWIVWRANFGRRASEEQGARSMEPEGSQAMPHQPAGQPQPPASPGGPAASRLVLRPPTQRFAPVTPAENLMSSLVLPRATSTGRSDFASVRRPSMREMDADFADLSTNAVDRVFESLGANVAGTLGSIELAEVHIP
jgi:CSLREA domain-containing protein